LSSKKSDESRIWGWIGRIAVIIGLIWGAIQIINYFSQKDAEIVAEGQFYRLVIPDPIIEDFKKKNERINANEIEKLLPEKLEGRYSVASGIADFINKDKSIITATELSNLSTYWEFQIQNNGSKESSDLKLELPIKGYYRINKRGESSTGGKFENIISIGNLRPSNSVLVLVWTNEFVSEYRAQEAKVTSPNGVISVSQPTLVKGGYAWFYNNIFPIIFFSVIGGFIVIVLFLFVIDKYFIVTPRNSVPEDQENEKESVETKESASSP
jgi:hypothetical protein